MDTSKPFQPSLEDPFSSLDRISEMKTKQSLDNPYDNLYDSDINSVSNQSYD
eukprot:CAMPEP_0172356510 /NCGR_PEP_ID=MMETSP1060-20121228/880_1 /TAXON_ID=37318 /ORGANISM="Pseudo-nitzschia pungens, Strain cf. cingulata" /LENGTH=51 /DNA_ID=CAMNT_0013076649 /DNA_START=1 /DNA_END=153 /DNA_ORIENTATION=-